jgi:maltooligosyltrehalose trehalohydrolase
VLDVVYNHLGPSGNVLPALAKNYFHPSAANLWGDALNFDGEGSAAVRQFFLQNACQWFDEFRVDGLRLDAVHAIEDKSEPHIIAQIAAAAHARGAFVIAEDERNDAAIITPAEQDGRSAHAAPNAKSRGWGVDGMWSDDFHHVMRVALTGQREAHFANYTGATDEWIAALREGWFYRGQPFKGWQGRPRGTPANHLEPERFVFCISNHDQVGNRPLGDRLHAVISPAAYRAVSMLVCLSPYTPLIFMGQEWAANTPFPFFTDHPGEIGAKMRANRLREFQHYNATYDAATLERMPDPQAEATFRQAKLDWMERERPPQASVLALYRACLQLRAKHAIFQSPPRDAWQVDRVGDGLIGLRWHETTGDWLLLVTVADRTVSVAGSNAFVRNRDARRWRLVLGSEEERFGGGGVPRAARGETLALHGPAAALWREA